MLKVVPGVCAHKMSNQIGQGGGLAIIESSLVNSPADLKVNKCHICIQVMYRSSSRCKNIWL